MGPPLPHKHLQTRIGYVDCKGLAEYLSVSEDTIELWVRQGLIPPPYKIGERTRRWRLKAVDDWLDERNNAPRIGSIADAVRKEMERH